MITRLKLTLFTLLLALCHLSKGQNIAVQANITLTPPYTLSLHDYTQSGSNKLMVSILLKDLNITTHQVRLRFTIEGNGFTLTTKAAYMPIPISLQGGVPVLLGATDLEPYFQPENLDFNGLSKSDYLRTRKLPEGFYRFYVEVLDYNRGSLLSNKGIAVAYMVLNEPPLINLPVNNTKLPANDPQTILFNWAPRHLGSPNSAFSTAYEFRLYEIQPKGRSPYEVVRTSKPFYEAVPSLTSTSFVYNVAMPSLVPGNQYAFTVRAVDREGRDLFKNDGYSDVSMFTWGDECKAPPGITADTVSGGGIALSWKTAPAHTGYNLSYRVAGSTSWNIQNTLMDNATIYELPANTLIEYMLQSVCGGYQSDYSKIQTIKTKQEEKRSFSCGSGNSLPAITNTTPKKALSVGDQFTAGGYTAKVTKVSGQDGTFTGECNVLVPFFNMAKVPHKFENIRLNELSQMYEGKLVSIYNPNSKFLVRDKQKGSGTNIETAKQTNTRSTSETAQAGNSDTLKVSFPVDTIVKAGNGDILIVSGGGDTTTIHTTTDGKLVAISATGDTTSLKTGETVAVTDSEGKTTVIDSNENISATKNSNNSEESAATVSNTTEESIRRTNYIIINGNLSERITNGFSKIITESQAKKIYFAAYDPNEQPLFSLMNLNNEGNALKEGDKPLIIDFEWIGGRNFQDGDPDYEKKQGYKDYALLLIKPGKIEHKVTCKYKKYNKSESKYIPYEVSFTLYIQPDNALKFERMEDNDDENRWGYDENEFENLLDDHVSIKSGDYTFVKLTSGSMAIDDKKFNELYFFDYNDKDVSIEPIGDKIKISSINGDEIQNETILKVYSQSDKTKLLAQLTINIFKEYFPYKKGQIFFVGADERNKNNIHLENLVEDTKKFLKYSIVELGKINTTVQFKQLETYKFDTNHNGIFDVNTEFPLFKKALSDLSIYDQENIIILDIPILRSYTITEDLNINENTISLNKDIEPDLLNEDFCIRRSDGTLSSPFKISKKESKKYELKEGRFTEKFAVTHTYIQEVSNKGYGAVYGLSSDIKKGSNIIYSSSDLLKEGKTYVIKSADGRDIETVTVNKKLPENNTLGKYAYKVIPTHGYKHTDKVTLLFSESIQLIGSNTIVLVAKTAAKTGNVAGFSNGYGLPIILYYNTKISPKTIAHEVGHSLKLKTKDRRFQDLDEQENLMYFQENEVNSLRPLRFKCINNKHYPEDTIDEKNCNQWNTIDRTDSNK